MRKFFIMFMVLFTFSMSAQEKQKTELVKVSTDRYFYTENNIDDTTHQKGYFQLTDGELKRDGEWKQYVHGDLKTVAEYSNDRLVYLIVDGVKYDKKDLKIFRLEKRIKDLVSN